MFGCGGRNYYSWVDFQKIMYIWDLFLSTLIYYYFSFFFLPHNQNHPRFIANKTQRTRLMRHEINGSLRSKWSRIRCVLSIWWERSILEVRTSNGTTHFLWFQWVLHLHITLLRFFLSTNNSKHLISTMIPPKNLHH